MTNVVQFNDPQSLTPSEKARTEQLVWTEDMGRGWKIRPISSSDSHFLIAIERRLGARQEPTDRVMVIAQLARLANHFRSERPADAWQMLFEDYAEDLAGISETHLREIITAQRNERSWFPKSAELIERWNLLRYRETEQWRRTRILLGFEQPKPWEYSSSPEGGSP